MTEANTDVADDTLDDEQSGDAKDENGNAGADQLGDAGKKALDAMKLKWTTERDARKKFEAELAEARKPKPEEGAQPDIETLRNEALATARAEAMRDKALDKIEAKARMFKNPEDAKLHLGARVDDFIDGTTVDVDAINEALSALLTERPYLGVTQGDEKRFLGSADAGKQGTGNGGKPSQLTRAEVEQLARDGKNDEINKARVEGRLDKIMGIT